jgi:hypothetical protein
MPSLRTVLLRSVLLRSAIFRSDRFRTERAGVPGSRVAPARPVRTQAAGARVCRSAAVGGPGWTLSVSNSRIATSFVVFQCFVAIAALSTPSALAADWPSWRGSENRGYSRETSLPATWSPDGENLLWSKDFGARSSPVVHGNRVYLLNLVGEGVTEQERVVCLDAQTGKELWEHRFNVFLTDIPNTRVGWASPVVDVETGNVYVHGVQGLFICLDPQGRVIWERSLAEEFGKISGYGGRTHTPIIDEDRVIISFLNSSWGPQGKGGHRYLALDKRSGAVVWWAEPGGAPHDTTYSHPAIAIIRGERLLIAGNADGSIHAIRARTGQTVWSFRLSKRGLNASVVVRGDLVYACHSEDNLDTADMGRVVCIDATGTGDVTATHEKWRANEVGVGYSTPALDDDSLYVVDNSANIICFDPLTGEKRWVQSAGTVMKASPVVADGKLYLGSVSGSFSIFEISKTGAKLLSEHTFSTPDGRPLEVNGSVAIASGRIYFPTSLGLYCIGAKEWKGTSGAEERLRPETKPAPGAVGAFVQLVPADVTLYPGQSVFFKARLFDDRGRYLEDVIPTFAARGLAASIGAEGKLTIPSLDPAARGSGFQQGFVVAAVNGVEGQARVRVVPKLPLRLDFEDIETGKTPVGWIGASPVKFEVVEKDGSKVFSKKPDDPRFVQVETYFGLPTWTNYTVQADVLGTTKRRQMPNIGLINARYQFQILGNTQRAQIVSWIPGPRIEAKVPFAWKPDQWYRMKFRIDRDGDKAVVRGKVWARGDAEPAEWTVTMTDPVPTWTGSPGMTGYSAGTTDRSPGTSIYWDNIVVEPSAP